MMLPNIMPTLLPALCMLAATGTCETIHLKPSRFQYTKMKTQVSGPCDVTQGPDGLIWIQEITANQLARYNQHTKELTEYPIPFTIPGFPATQIPLPGGAKAELFSCALRGGFDGYLYASNGAHNQLVRHNVTSGVTKVFTPPSLAASAGNLEPLNDITSAPDGIYFTMTSANKIAKFDYRTHEFTMFEVPTPLSNPLGIYYASDDGIWFLELTASKFARLDRYTHEIVEYQIPVSGLAPVVVRAETVDDQNHAHIYAACVGGGSVADINLQTKEITVHIEAAPGSNTIEDAQDYANNVWATHFLRNTLAVLNPKTGNFTEIVIPGTLAATSPASVPVFGGTGIFGKPVGSPTFGHPNTGNAMWFTKLLTNELVRLDLDGLEFP